MTTESEQKFITREQHLSVAQLPNISLKTEYREEVDQAAQQLGNFRGSRAAAPPLRSCRVGGGQTRGAGPRSPGLGRGTSYDGIANSGVVAAPRCLRRHAGSLAQGTASTPTAERPWRRDTSHIARKILDLAQTPQSSFEQFRKCITDLKDAV